MRKYASQVAGTLAPFGPKYVVRDGKVTPVEGDASKGRFIVIGLRQCREKTWEDSPANEAIKPLRHACTKSRILIIEGVPPQGIGTLLVHSGSGLISGRARGEALAGLNAISVFPNRIGLRGGPADQGPTIGGRLELSR